MSLTTHLVNSDSENNLKKKKMKDLLPCSFHGKSENEQLELYKSPQKWMS